MAILALFAGIMMIYKKYKQKDKLGFGEDILVGGEQAFKGRRSGKTKSFIRFGQKMLNMDEAEEPESTLENGEGNKRKAFRRATKKKVTVA